MNYAKEREIANKKKLKAKMVVFIIVAVFILALSVVSCFVPMGTWKYYVSLPKIDKRAPYALRIHFLDVGQGDATLVELPDGKVMLIDGGDDEESHKTTLLRYLNALKIDVIDYLIVTHTDSDHVGGLDVVAKYKDVKTAFLPKHQTMGAQYLEFEDELQKQDCEIRELERTFISKASNENSYALSVLYPYIEEREQETEDDNETSGVVWLSYQGVDALFMGDVSSKVENVLMQEDKDGLLTDFATPFYDTEILKVGHHGSASATSTAFIEYVKPETAVISCGKNNAYGHPAEQTLKTLLDREIAVYRTDEQGHIMITVEQGETEYAVQTIEN
ncbi:MAG: MBL fold metallo-hydrolase [Clostridia bacterium]|nr:MBL fold metallo-hydrolase [Clostridia bacterium]